MLDRVSAASGSPCLPLSASVRSWMYASVCCCLPLSASVCCGLPLSTGSREATGDRESESKASPPAPCPPSPTPLCSTCRDDFRGPRATSGGGGGGGGITERW